MLSKMRGITTVTKQILQILWENYFLLQMIIIIIASYQKSTFREDHGIFSDVWLKYFHSKHWNVVTVLFPCIMANEEALLDFSFTL